jgi:hypothetical protein
MIDEVRAAPGGAGSNGLGSVLVLDYTGRRPEAPVSELNLESRGYTVHYLLNPPFPRRLSADAYARELLDRLGSVGDVRAVLAYCMAAPIAQELAAAVHAVTGRALPLILFDGEPASTSGVQEQYEIALRKLGDLLGVDPARLTPPAPLVERALREHPEKELQAMRAGLLRVGEIAAADAPDDSEDVMADAEAITEYYLDWLSHLVAAHNTSWPAWGGPAYQIASHGHECGSSWPSATRTVTVPIDTSRIDLMKEGRTAEAVVSILAGEAEHAA